MTKVYVETSESTGSVLNISTQPMGSIYQEVILKDPAINFDKLPGYEVIFTNSEYCLVFNQEKYDAYIAEQKKEEAVLEGKELAEQLASYLVLTSATDEQAYIMRYLYPEYDPNSHSYKKDDRFIYNNKFYKVLQDHTSQEEWTPDTAVSLYVEIADPNDEWPAFKQPSGAHDAYMKDDKVTFNGKHYTSLIDNNTWSPDDYPDGWKLVEEE